jgi:hypothetical protein
MVARSSEKGHYHRCDLFLFRCLNLDFARIDVAIDGYIIVGRFDIQNSLLPLAPTECNCSATSSNDKRSGEPSQTTSSEMFPHLRASL